MKRIELGQLVYFQFDRLSGFENVVHGVFGRHGGVSGGQHRSLNVSFAVGDEPELVRDNRRIICGALAIPYSGLVVAKQVHGVDVVVIDKQPKPTDPDEWYSLLPNADGLITRESGYYLLMTFGDCVPLVCYDPVTQALGISHAGWKGTAANVARHSVEAMARAFGSSAHDMIVGVGPSIGPCCYEVKEDVISAVKSSGSNSDGLLLEVTDSSIHLDLWEMNRRQLIEAGVAAENIEVARLCTACNTDTLYSNRAERGRTGRFGVVIGLRPSA